jgi:uncharacterized protein YjbI with pentapeptide repeats
MIQNIRWRNFQGRSFKGADLTGEDFSDSDIRGADFTDANLTGANFSRAKAGLQPHWAIALLIVSLLLSALAGFMSTTVSFAAARYFLPRDADVLASTGLVAQIATFSIYGVFGLITLRQGLWNAAIALGGTGAVLSVVYGVMDAIVDISKRGTLGIAANGITVGIAAVATAGALSLAVAGTIAATGLVAGKRAIVAAGIVAVVASIVGAQMSLIAVPRTEALPAAKVGGIASVAIVLLCMYLSWRVLKGDETNTWVRTIAIAIATTGGTRFHQANLTNANFSYAILKNTDLRSANITRTFWLNAKQLDWARVGETILTQPAVRNLLVSGTGYKKSYVGMNLRGANLIGAELTGANFKEANLSQATLRDADLEGANLTQTQAIRTDFTKAHLTGAFGLGKWNIDNTTELKEVDCRYFYLLEEPKPRTDDLERRPSSGEFAPGEFNKRFQEFLDTIELFFSDGFDGAVFNQSFQRVQIENEDTELEMIGVENKGDGVFFVKVKVPSDANKGKIHSQFMQFYQEALALTTHQQKVLESHTQEIQNIKAIVDRIVAKPMTEKLVLLNFGNGDFERGFETVMAQILSDGHPLPTTFTGNLPPKPEIPELYKQWHQKYDHLRLCYQAQERYFRIKLLPQEVRQVSFRDIPQLIEEIQDLANELKEQVNLWLDSELFSPIQKKLRSNLNPGDRAQILIQSADTQMRHLPWHLWDFFEEYRQTEVAFSSTIGDRIKKSISPRNQLRILAIQGNSEGIDVDKDRQFIENLPNAETVFLVEPSRQEFDEALWDEKGWDILCFSGHSSSQWDGSSGYLEINQTEKLAIEQLKNALKAAIERGLHLAIFNSCNGLGLAQQLNNLHIPQIIVMREFVPDLVAQKFLKNFLTAFSGGKSLHLSVREAREKLQSLEDKFPCASWLPAICQNQAELPKTWQESISTD